METEKQPQKPGQALKKAKAQARMLILVAAGLSLIASGARVITAAALIMVAVFGSFILADDPTTKQFGLGLAFAIAIDATLIRCVLVPTIMVIFGMANWWLPSWLDRILPRVGIEGRAFLEKLDSEQAALRELGNEDLQELLELRLPG